MSNLACYPNSISNQMDNKIENKLVVVSGPEHGQEFVLSQGRTTIGSASHNDVMLADTDVSGFHAEIRIENDAYFISDFNSETGTFINGERVTSEVQVTAGDEIQIGSTRTVFIPRNAIFIRDSQVREDSDGDPKIDAFKKHKKWLFTGCAVVLMLCAMKIMLANDDRPSTDKKPVASNVSSSGQATGTTNGEKTSFSVGARTEGARLNNGAAVAARDRQSPISQMSGPLDKIATVNFEIANKFASYQLWKAALDHYRSVAEKNPGYPKLSEKIEGMRFEINNQIAFQQGQSLLRLGRYEKGIALLENIKEKSYYYPKAMQEIVEAEKTRKNR